MGKNIQLPLSAFLDLYRLIAALESFELDTDTRAIAKRLDTVIDAKIESMQRRSAYSAYKTAPTEEEREAARQEYLDLAGIHEDWRWSAEWEQSYRKD